MPFNPANFLLDGGAGGLSIAPTSTATTGAIDNRLSFGSSTVGPTTAANVAPLLLTGVFVLAGIFVWKKVK